MLAGALTAAAAIWVAIIAAAPLAASSGRFTTATLFVYQIGSLICHQRPERSFHLALMQMPVCARCSGVYAGAALGAITAWTVRGRWSPGRIRAVLVLAALPIAVSVALEWMGAIATTNLFRTATGLPLGAAAGLVAISVLRKAPRYDFENGK
jgi:uncharacterized membrane protein